MCRMGVSRALGIGALLAAVMVLGAGCTGDGEPEAAAEGDDDAAAEEAEADEADEAEADEAASEHQRLREEPARIEVHVEGAISVDWQGVRPMLFNRLGGPEVEVNFLSVGHQVPVPLDEPTERLRWGVDLLGVYDDEPGTFTFEAAADQGLENVAVLVFMEVVPERADEEVITDEDDVVVLEQFDEIGAACTFEIGPDERSGSLECPELADAEGRTVSLEVRWSDHGLVEADGG